MVVDISGVDVVTRIKTFFKNMFLKLSINLPVVSVVVVVSAVVVEAVIKYKTILIYKTNMRDVLVDVEVVLVVVALKREKNCSQIYRCVSL